jgi:hypothetical protein
METWEIIIAFHHARLLAGIMPNAQLSHALANFIFTASKELEERGEWSANQLMKA